MNVLKLSLAATAAAVALGAASAASAAEVSYNVGAATDYVFRGVDQTGFGSEGQLFAGVDATFEGNFYAGAWVSNTGPSGFGLFEADFYAGWKPALGPVTLDLGVIYYGYNSAGSGNSDYEVKLGGSVPAGPLSLGAAVYYGPDNDAFGGLDTYYVEGTAGFTYNKVAISAAIGNFSVDTLGDYNTWNLGATVPVTETISFDARYIGTEAGGFTGAVATLKATF